MNPKYLLQESQEFVQKNLNNCVLEILSWKETGVLKEGYVRQLVKLLPVPNLPLAESLISNAAMKKLVEVKNFKCPICEDNFDKCPRSYSGGNSGPECPMPL